ncbi:Uncharacterised protein [uncultured archaeon]|nr:Uncharacterised protein [uncultured archaeon]
MTLSKVVWMPLRFAMESSPVVEALNIQITLSLLCVNVFVAVLPELSVVLLNIIVEVPPPVGMFEQLGAHEYVRFCTPLDLLYASEPIYVHGAPPVLLTHAFTVASVFVPVSTVTLNVQLNPQLPLLVPVSFEIARAFVKLTVAAAA